MDATQTAQTKATTPSGNSQGKEAPLSVDELRGLDAYWRASNYLSVGQIYLLDNPLLRETLQREHIKPRLLGHWGTSPGLNMLCVHLNRVIRRDDLDVIYVIGPGHGGPSLVAHAYLEGTYSEVYPEISQDAEGMQRLFKQFSFPGGIPSHVAPETPGSIHEGGELGYALSHAYGAAFDNPDLIVACVVGDGEAENRPARHRLARRNKFPNPARDGCGVLPIPPPERVQDRQPLLPRPDPEGGAPEVLRGDGLQTVLRRGSRAGGGLYPAARRRVRRGRGGDRDPADPGRRPPEREPEAVGLADDRLPHPEGLDLPPGDRRQEV